MKWSQLPQRKKQAAVGTGVLVLAMLFGLSAYSDARQKLQADITPDSAIPGLDTGGFPGTTIKIEATGAGDAKVAADIDVLFNDNPDIGFVTDYVPSTPAEITDLTDGCYTLKATAKEGEATASKVVAVGLIDPASCGEGVEAVENNALVTLKLQ